MKKLLPVAAACLSAMFLMSGCTETILPGEPGKDPEKKKVEIKATTEAREGVQGRSTLNGNQVVWTEGDEFILYDAATSAMERFTLTGEAGATTGTFSGYLPEGTDFVALYGAGSDPNEALLYHLPAQAYVAGGFAPYSNPMLATSADPTAGLEFQNLMGILELRITGTKTVREIKVDAGEGQYLSGVLTYDHSDLSVFHDTNSEDAGYSYVTLTDINEALDETVAKPFNLVLPPGTYDNLTVTITNTDGSIVTRTAQTPIEIVRNRITPIGGLTDGEDTAEPLVSIAIDQETSNWHKCAVTLTINENCAKQYYCLISESDLQDWNNNNPEGSDFDLVISNGGMSEESVGEYIFTYNIIPETTYYFYAFGEDAGGNRDAAVQRIAYTPVIPYDGSLSTDVAIQDLTTTSATAVVTATGAIDHVMIKTYIQEVIDNNADPVIFRDVALNGLSRSLDGGSETNVQFGGFMPNTNYVTVCIGVGADGSFARMKTASFTTPEHQASTATVTITEEVVEDFYAKFSFTLGENSTKYVAKYFTQTAYDNLTGQGTNIADYLNTYFSGNPLDRPSLAWSDLNPETDYIMCAIAYDAEGIYGELVTHQFTTRSLFAVPNETYTAMLGDWTLECDVDTDGDPDTPDEKLSFRINIAQDVEGKTFSVSGLQGPEPYMYDDGIIARFINNEIRLYAGASVANGNPAADYNNADILFCVYDNNANRLLVGDSYLKGTLNGDDITFNSPYTGYMFYFFDRETGAGMGSIQKNVYKNVVLHRAIASDAGSTTPLFEKAAPITPQWSNI